MARKKKRRNSSKKRARRNGKRRMRRNSKKRIRRNSKRRMRRNAGKKGAAKKVAAKKPAKSAKKQAKKPAKQAKKPAKGKAAKPAAAKKRKKLTPAQKARRAKTALKRLSKSASKAARAMGMIKSPRKNPGGVVDFLKAEAKDMMALAPSIAVQLGAMAAVGYASSMASAQIRKRATAGSAFDKYAGVISSGAVTIAAFAAMKMIKNEKARQFTLPVLFGGMAATAVHALAAIKVKKDAADVSLGQRLGLPIGDYMALSGFVDVHGRPLAVDGYVAESLGALRLSQGPYHEGTVIGDYAAESLGALQLREGPYHEGTVLGEIGQMSEGRQGARALDSEGDSRIESFVDRGSLSGSVFD